VVFIASTLTWIFNSKRLVNSYLFANSDWPHYVIWSSESYFFEYWILLEGCCSKQTGIWMINWTEIFSSRMELWSILNGQGIGENLQYQILDYRFELQDLRGRWIEDLVYPVRQQRTNSSWASKRSAWLPKTRYKYAEDISSNRNKRKRLVIDWNTELEIIAIRTHSVMYYNFITISLLSKKES